MGIMGKALSISANDQELLTLAKGEYTLVYLQPFTGALVTKSSAVVMRGGQNVATTVKSTEAVSFAAGETYCLVFMRRDDFSSGTTFVPVSVPCDRVRGVAGDVKPVGEAVRFPLNGLATP